MRPQNEWQQQQMQKIAITFLISSFLVLRSVGVWAGEKPELITVVLPESYEVTSATADVVTIGDMAEKIVGEHPAEIEELKRVPVIDVPDPGKATLCTSARMVGASRVNGFEGFGKLHFEGPRAFKVYGLGSTITKEHLLEKVMEDIKKDLEWDPNELSVRILSFPDEIRVPHGDVKVRVYRTSQQRYGAVRYDLTILINDEEYLHRGVIVSIAHRRDVFVFRKHKDAGSIVTLKDVDVQKRYIRSERDDEYVISNARELVGRKLARSVNRGLTATRDLFAHTYLIPRGKEVNMMVRAGNMRIEVRGRTQQNGNIGDIVRVKNLFNKEIVRARIVGSGVVEML